MHTLMVLASGFLLLAICLAAAYFGGGRKQSMLARGALAFVPVWLACCIYNLWMGVTEAGYTLIEEAPIFSLLYGAPSICAFYVWRHYTPGAKDLRH